MRVEIMGDMQHRRADGSWEPIEDLRGYVRFVDLDNLRIPVLDLGHERDAYRALGRPERADQIQRYLDQHGRS